MIYAIMVFGTLLTALLLSFLNKKYTKHTTVFLKTFAYVFFAVFLVRLFMTDTIGYIVGLDTNFMSPAMLVFINLLRWFTFAGVLIVSILPFFKIKTLENLAAFFLPLTAILNIIFFSTHLIAFEGANFDINGIRAIQFAIETILFGGFGLYFLYKKISEKDFVSFKVQLKYMAMVLPLILLAIIPLNMFQNIFGFIGGEADGFTLTHRITFYILILAPMFIFAAFKNKSYTIQRAALITMSLACVISYVDIMDIANITFVNLPLHLCNTGVFLIFIAFTLKIKSVYYFTYIVNVIGGIIAITLPNTTGDIFRVSNMHFWINHIYISFLPILAMMFKHYERPNLKMMRGAIYIFTIYFITMIIANAYINSFASVDYFFLYKDQISSKIAFLDPIRLNNVWLVWVNGTSYKVFWLYAILVYVGYIFLMFMIWLLYTALYRVEDHYTELYQIRKIDTLELSKFKKELNGRPMSSPINEKGTGMIKVTNFSKVYGHSKVKSVDDFNLEVQVGEVFGFLGHNGAGKSTLIKSMVGIQSITEGKIEICGYDIAKQPLQAKLKIGYVSDNHAVYENLTGREYVNYVADLYLVDKANRDERIQKYVELFNLAHAVDNQIKTYSHGMKQKIVVIAALIHEPKVWILDEPLTGLDPTSAYQIKEAMRQHADKGNIVFFSSHVIEVVEKICDRIAIIKQGKLQGVFDVKELHEKDVDMEELYISYIENNEEKRNKLLNKLEKSKIYNTMEKEQKTKVKSKKEKK